MASQNINSELGILKANGYLSRFMQWSQTISNEVYSKVFKVHILWEGHKNMNFKVVYDRKHLFGLGPIPKQRIGRNFWQIPKLTKTVKS